MFHLTKCFGILFMKPWLPHSRIRFTPYECNIFTRVKVCLKKPSLLISYNEIMYLINYPVSFLTGIHFEVKQALRCIFQHLCLSDAQKEGIISHEIECYLLSNAQYTEVMVIYLLRIRVQCYVILSFRLSIQQSKCVISGQRSFCYNFSYVRFNGNRLQVCR